MNQRLILNQVSFQIQPGESIALIGANGSGKTTLARHLNALLIPVEGNIFVNGLNTRDQKCHAKIRATVGMVFQQPEDQIISGLVEEDVAFGLENLCCESGKIRSFVSRALAEVGMTEFSKRPTHLLSSGQLQRVALAGVLAMQPSVVIFDESTAMLDPAGRRDVLCSMDKLHESGTTVIQITHRMEEVLHSERVLLLNHGSLVFDGTPAELFSNRKLTEDCGLELPAIIAFQMAVPRWFSAQKQPFTQLKDLASEIPGFSGYPTSPIQPVRLGDSHSGELAEIRNLAFSYSAGSFLSQPSLVDVSFTIRQDHVHGLAGATGAGKSTLLQHMNGLYRPQQGAVRIGPFDLNSKALDVKALRRYAGLVFQNPELYFFKQYVGDEIAFGPRMLGADLPLREQVQWAMELVGLDFETYKDRIVSTLSGGEQRKVALAAGLALRPNLLILDEPTAGLDPKSRRKLMQNLKQMQTAGMQLLFSSHQMEELAEIAADLTVLSQGVSLMSAPVGQVFNDRALLQRAGLEQPFAVQLADILREKGWGIPSGVMTPDALFSTVQRLTREGAHA